jgi:hypothetical protein
MLFLACLAIDCRNVTRHKLSLNLKSIPHSKCSLELMLRKLQAYTIWSDTNTKVELSTSDQEKRF